MRARILMLVLLSAVFIAATESASALVPVEVQLVLFTKIWRLDRNFDSAGVVTVVIVYQAGYPDSRLVKDDFVATVQRLKLPIRCIPLEAGSPELLRKGLSEIRDTVVYVTPLRSVDVAEIARISRGRGLRTMTGVPDYVEQGIAVGIGERKERPLIIINVLGARAEGSDFDPQLLSLARIVEPLAPVLSPDSAQGQVADEYQVKAAYLLNFARFVEWPVDVLPASSPLQIVVVGEDPFGGALEEVLRGKSANGHPIEFRHQRWNDVLTAYEIVFISVSEERHLPQILRYLGHSSVLTVSDIDRFSLRGGVIEFRTVGNRVRFDINRTSALAAQLNISSKLLSVARAIQEGSAPQ